MRIFNVPMNAWSDPILTIQGRMLFMR